MNNLQLAITKIKEQLQQQELHNGYFVICCPIDVVDTYLKACQDAQLKEEFQRRGVHPIIRADFGIPLEDTKMGMRTTAVALIVASELLAQGYPKKNDQEWRIELLSRAIDLTREMTDEQIDDYVINAFSKQ
ncbi:MAG: hypothetical protein Fur006_69530 [Coleofasciculaceae cyanobacterium]